MKQRWKKIGSLIAIGVLTISLSACGQEKEGINETVAENLYQNSLSTVQSLVQYDNATMEQAIAENPNMDEFVKGAFEAWVDASEELGALQELEESTAAEAVKMSSNQYIVTFNASFANREGTVEMIYDSKLNAEDIAFNANYSMGEKMMDAGMNTIVGLATVFIMLFFLSWVISLMKHIPGLVDSFTKKRTEEAPAVPAAPEMPAAAAEEEELADDGALVAVIAAAIAASENTSTDSFVVRSIRKSKKRNWR